MAGFTPAVRLGRGAHSRWLAAQSFTHPALHIVLAEYIQAIEDAGVRLDRLTKQVAETAASWSMVPVVEAYQAMRGIAFISAVTFVVEIGDIRRFETAPQLMAYLGLVPSRSICGGPILIPAQAMGSTIQPDTETTTPDGPSTLRNRLIARSSTRRTLTLRPDANDNEPLVLCRHGQNEHSTASNRRPTLLMLSQRSPTTGLPLAADHVIAIFPSQYRNRLKLKAILARLILALARSMSMVRMNSPMRCFWVANTCSTAERWTGQHWRAGVDRAAACLARDGNGFSIPVRPGRSSFRSSGCDRQCPPTANFRYFPDQADHPVHARHGGRHRWPSMSG